VSASNLGRKTYGKTDFGFFGFDVTIQDDDKLGKVFVDKNTGEVIPMEAVEAIDLGSQSVD
jgi:uncharacterized protein YcfJ